MCFWNIEAYRSILVDPKNKIMKCENEHNRASLKELFRLFTSFYSSRMSSKNLQPSTSDTYRFIHTLPPLLCCLRLSRKVDCNSHVPRGTAGPWSQFTEVILLVLMVSLCFSQPWRSWCRNSVSFWSCWTGNI